MYNKFSWLLGNTNVQHFWLLGDTNDDEAHYKDMVDRDERRWKRADKNQDGALTKEEFMDFLHPEEAENMKDIVVEVLFHFNERSLCSLPSFTART